MLRVLCQSPFESTNSRNATSPRKRARRQAIVDDDEDAVDTLSDQAVAGPSTTSTTGNSSGNAVPGASSPYLSPFVLFLIRVLTEVRLGATYEPSTLPDFSGLPCFNLDQKKLIQADVRDRHGDLIHPKDYLTKLRPGTLVIIRATLHRFDMPVAPGYRRPRRVSYTRTLIPLPTHSDLMQIYQINAMSTKVVDDSAEPVPTITPIEPPAGVGEVPSSKPPGPSDDEIDPFKDFSFDTPGPSDSAVNPTQPGTDLKGKGKEKAPANNKGRKRARAETPMDVEI